MELIERKGGGVFIRLSDRELMIAHNALHEVCRGVEVPKFSSRIGAEEPEADKLFEEFHAVLERTRQKA